MYVPVCEAAFKWCCCRLLVMGKLMRLCQHPNNASKIFTFLLLILRSRRNALKELPTIIIGNSVISPYPTGRHPPGSFVSYLMLINPDSVHWFFTTGHKSTFSRGVLLSSNSENVRRLTLFP